jgi:hypothetical protein
MAKRRAGSRKRRTTPGAKRPVRSRARRLARTTDAQSGWNPSRFALWSQRWGNPGDDNQTYPTTVLLRHPTAPFIGTGTISNFEHFEYDLRKTAHDYLVAANTNPLIDPPLGLPHEWLDALDPDQPGGDPSFGWLPLEQPGTQQPAKPLLSFGALRTNAPEHAADLSAFLTNSSEGAPDLIVILLASQPTGSGFGIRAVAHIRIQSPSQFEIDISGMSASLPFGLFRPAPLPQPLARAALARARETALPFIDFLISALFKNMIASTLGLERSTVAIQGVRLSPVMSGPSNELHVYAESNATGQTKKTKAAAPNSIDLEPYYSFVLATKVTRSDANPPSSSPLALVSKITLVADAGPARVFPIDPSSQKGATDLHKRRPTRSEDVLDSYRTTVSPLPSTPNPLVYAPDGYNDEVVVVCPGFVLEDHGQAPTAYKTVNLPGSGPPVRSNDSSAVMAYWNVKQFFDRLRAYGLPPNSYFRIAPLPLEVHYRSGIRPGPGKDGQTVNARVRVKGFPDNFEGPVPLGSTIEMHLALADLSTRARKPWDGTKPSPAEPLGIAADERWIWHEIGHVLLTTSVGELQFRFAHSPGDALAAIVSDPESELATDPNWRGATFPWVFLPRRHDRCVAVGWSWGGTMHYALSQVPNSAGPRRKAYWSEQILSSSLFRLYRCIGGDTTMVALPSTPDSHARRSASHYCVYLIMRAIQILGTSLVVPANDPDQFVSALIDADKNTALNAPWHVLFPPVFPPDPNYNPADPNYTFDRIGGCVHKVIRWAFEAQGLYNPFGKITNAPGAPPKVDVYIRDLRPISETTPYGEINYGAGSYNPVSLEWDPYQTQNSVPPKWQADPAAITVLANGKISVVVGNRGTMLATNVEVSVWWHEWPTAGPLPQWDATWTQCPLAGPASKNIPSGGQVTFGKFAAVPLPTGRRYLLLARATCADDRANNDPATNLPCSQQPTPLLDLVANDNNLGLWVFGHP